MSEHVQIIEKDGHPEYAVVPFDTWLQIVEQAEQAADQAAYAQAMSDLANGKDEIIPDTVAKQLLQGEVHPVQIWREYRQLSQEALASAAGVDASWIIQLERGQVTGSLHSMQPLAKALRVEVDDLMH